MDGLIRPASSHISSAAPSSKGNVRQTWPFLTHNRKLMEKVSTMEDKIRRHDLLADEEQIARFYEERLPGHFMMSGPSRS